MLGAVNKSGLGLVFSEYIFCPLSDPSLSLISVLSNSEHIMTSAWSKPTDLFGVK